MAPKESSTLSSVKASEEFVSKKCRGVESTKYTTGQNRKIKTFRTYRTEKTRKYLDTFL